MILGMIRMHALLPCTTGSHTYLWNLDDCPMRPLSMSFIGRQSAAAATSKEEREEEEKEDSGTQFS